MSFILDALKKSENERQRNIGPSLAEIQVRHAQSERPWWAVVVAGLLVLNLGVLLIVLMRDPAPSTPAMPIPEQQPVSAVPQPQPVTAPSPAATQQAGVQPGPAPYAVAPAPTRASPAVRSLAEVADPAPYEPYEDEPPYNPALAGAARVPDRPPVVQPMNPSTAAATTGQTTFPAARPAPADDVMLPTHASLVANGVALPDMRLDIHVYHSNPRERFVFVNMRKYVEGQVVSEGPLLERITTEGAVFSYNGQRFLVPRN
jgi:general secretion pathway protein B